MAEALLQKYDPKRTLRTKQVPQSFKHTDANTGVTETIYPLSMPLMQPLETDLHHPPKSDDAKRPSKLLVLLQCVRPNLQKLTREEVLTLSQELKHTGAYLAKLEHKQAKRESTIPGEVPTATAQILIGTGNLMTLYAAAHAWKSHPIGFETIMPTLTDRQFPYCPVYFHFAGFRAEHFFNHPNIAWCGGNNIKLTVHEATQMTPETVWDEFIHRLVWMASATIYDRFGRLEKTELRQKALSYFNEAIGQKP